MKRQLFIMALMGLAVTGVTAKTAKKVQKAVKKQTVEVAAPTFTEWQDLQVNVFFLEATQITSWHSGHDTLLRLSSFCASLEAFPMPPTTCSSSF